MANAPGTIRRLGISMGRLVLIPVASSVGVADENVEPAEDDKDSDARADAAEWRETALNNY